MTMQKGRDLVLKIGDGADEEIFTLVAVAKAVSLTVNNNVVDVTSLNCNCFMELQAKGGIQSISIKLDGIFKNSDAEEQLRAAAFNRDNNNYQLIFPNEDYIEGCFVVDNYKRLGCYNDLETFSMQLLSSSEYSFTKGE